MHTRGHPWNSAIAGSPAPAQTTMYNFKGAPDGAVAVSPLNKRQRGYCGFGVTVFEAGIGRGEADWDETSTCASLLGGISLPAG